MHVTHRVGRRTFIKTGTGALATLAAGRTAHAAADTIVVALMGANTRGGQLIDDILKVPGLEVGVIIDVDDNVAAKAAKKVEAAGRRLPATARDVRRTVADKGVDALVIAAPNHWQAPATILARRRGPSSPSPGRARSSRRSRAATPTRCSAAPPWTRCSAWRPRRRPPPGPRPPSARVRVPRPAPWRPGSCRRSRLGRAAERRRR